MTHLYPEMSLTPASLDKQLHRTPNRRHSPVPMVTATMDIFSAASAGSRSAVEESLMSQSPNQVNESGWTPLMYASHYGHYLVVRKLLSKGADPNVAEPSSGRTALMMAASAGHTRCLENLVANGADLKLKDFAGHDAAFHAQKNGHAGNRLIAQILAIKRTPRQPLKEYNLNHLTPFTMPRTTRMPERQYQTMTPGVGRPIRRALDFN